MSEFKQALRDFCDEYMFEMFQWYPRGPLKKGCLCFKCDDYGYAIHNLKEFITIYEGIKRLPAYKIDFFGDCRVIYFPYES